MREGGEDAHFWCKKGIGRILFLVLYLHSSAIDNTLGLANTIPSEGKKKATPARLLLAKCKGGSHQSPKFINAVWCFF